MLKPNDLIICKKSGWKGRILSEYLPGVHSERLFTVKYNKFHKEVLAWESSLRLHQGMLVPMKVDIISDASINIS